MKKIAEDALATMFRTASQLNKLMSTLPGPQAAELEVILSKLDTASMSLYDRFEASDLQGKDLPSFTLNENLTKINVVGNIPNQRKEVSLFKPIISK